MTQAAQRQEMQEPRLDTGRVLEAGADGPCRVNSGNAAFEAELAASCLLRPQRNDTVLLAEFADGSRIILAVLFRGAATEARLLLPPDASLECPGRLSLRAAEALELHSGQEMGLHTGALALTAKSGDLHIAKLRAVSDVAELCCRTFSSLGDTALAVFRSLTQCLGTSSRIVEGDDQTRARNSTLLVQENATVMSKNGLTLAEETARTDARLIQLG
jgi:hypothetical protein